MGKFMRLNFDGGGSEEDKVENFGLPRAIEIGVEIPNMTNKV